MEKTYGTWIKQSSTYGAIMLAFFVVLGALGPRIAMDTSDIALKKTRSDEPSAKQCNGPQAVSGFFKEEGTTERVLQHCGKERLVHCSFLVYHPADQVGKEGDPGAAQGSRLHLAKMDYSSITCIVRLI
jgi:hypothetical protein